MASLESLGYLDVTQAPFAADPTGNTDCTEALQRAIAHARDHQLVAFFPSGRYLISDTLDCEHGRYDQAQERWRPEDRAWPCVLRGSTRGPRPQIVLKPNAPGFDDPDQPRPAIYFWSRPLSGQVFNDGSINMNQLFAGIDITVGQGNPGAIGISHRAAQGSGVQDCTIDATHGYCGLEGGAGSGGGHFNVTILGGRIGADLRQTQPAPVIVGFTFTGQTETALLYNGLQSLSAVGCRFEKQIGRTAIVAGCGELVALRGQVCMTDCSIDFTKPGEHVAIEANASLYLNHVYVKGASTVVREQQGGTLTAAPEQWTCVKEFAYAQEDRQLTPKGATEPVTYHACVYVDGQRVERLPAETLADTAPPADLQARHIWDEATFPSWEDQDVVDVTAAPYHAQRDGSTDDTDALQRAIDEHAKVFLPKGTYAISKTLRLRPDTRLIGTHRCFSRLKPIASPGGDFNEPDQPRPVVHTSDAPDSQNILTGLSIDLPLAVRGAYCLNWQCGPKSIFREVDVDVEPNWDPQWEQRLGEKHPIRNHPAMRIEGPGAGRFYTFFQESWRFHGPDYRHLLVQDTAGPLAFYQCNPEHGRGDANMEVRRASHIDIFGIKGEGNYPAMIFRDCNHVRLIGYGGNASTWPGTALFVMENVTNFLLANLMDKPRFGFGFKDHFGGEGQDPDQWSMVRERTGDGTTVQTRPRERPVLYKRGQPA